MKQNSVYFVCMCKTVGSGKNVILGGGLREQGPCNDISKWLTKTAARCLRTPYKQGFGNSYRSPCRLLFRGGAN